MPLLLLIGAAVASAYLAFRYRLGEVHAGWLYLPPIVTTTVWLRVVRQAQDLARAAVLVDGVIAAVYLVTLACLGESAGWRTWAGMALIVAGIGVAR